MARSWSAGASPARTSRACSGSVGRRSSIPTTSCSTRRSCPRLRRARSSRATSSCRSARCARTPSCSSGRAVSRDPAAHSVVAETLGGTFEIAYERLVVALGAVTTDVPRARACRARARVQGRRRRDRAAQPPSPRARVRGSTARPGGGRARPRLRVRRCRLRRRRGARRAARPRARGRPPLVSRRSASVRQRWVLVDARRRSSPEIPRKLGEYTHRYLERRGIEIHVGTTLASFDELGAVLSDGTSVPARTLVWAAGVRAHPDLGAIRAAAGRARTSDGRARRSR